MITIIAEKPSVARQISRVVGAMERKVGYYGGNNYCVTWAFGHLIQLAMPEAYGVTGFRRESLPIIPDVFQLVSRKDAKGKEDDGVKEQALTIAAGKGTYSLGRVQTPTLAMVCRRFLENKNFVPTPFWQMHFTTEGDGKAVKFLTADRWKDKADAEALYQQLKGNRDAVISKVECKEKTEVSPLLYDLTALQKDANVKYGFTAEQTLTIAQKLYEAKAITYPRTSSRYIPDDVYDEIPKLLRTLADNEQWGALSMTIHKPNRHSVDASKVTDHHALLITGEKPQYPSNDDKKIYNLIIARMLEAFSDKCVKELTTVTVDVGGIPFVAKGTVIRQQGWRFIMNEDTCPTGRKVRNCTSRDGDWPRARPSPLPSIPRPRCCPRWNTAARTSTTRNWHRPLRTVASEPRPPVPPSSRRLSTASI